MVCDGLCRKHSVYVKSWLDPASCDETSACCLDQKTSQAKSWWWIVWIVYCWICTSLTLHLAQNVMTQIIELDKVTIRYLAILLFSDFWGSLRCADGPHYEPASCAPSSYSFSCVLFRCCQWRDRIFLALFRWDLSLWFQFHCLCFASQRFEIFWVYVDWTTSRQKFE